MIVRALLLVGQCQHTVFPGISGTGLLAVGIQRDQLLVCWIGEAIVLSGHIYFIRGSVVDPDLRIQHPG